MSDQREYRPGRPPVPGPPAGGRPPPPARTHPPGRPPGRPQPAGAVPLLTHDAAGGWSPVPSGPDVPFRSGAAGRPPGPPARAPQPPPPGRGVALAEPPRRPVSSGPAGPGDGGRKKRKAGPAAPVSRGRRWRRRVVRGLVVLLTLAVLVPVVAFLVGWAIFDAPSAADQAAQTQVATFRFADGSPLATIRPDNVNRTIVPIEQVPEHVRFAVLAAEDRSFYSNPGFDLTGIGRALWNQVTGGVGGGSTITQQYVKVSTGQDQASLLRKYKEIVLAVKISQQQSKDQILGNYLNVIYLGRGAYGIQAASQAYFGKDVKDLTVSEAAMLAGTIQSPSRWDPAKNEAKSRERWSFVLDGMVAQGWLPPTERALERFPEFLPEPPPTAGIPGDASGHVYNLAKAELEARGISEQSINTEGLTIDLTIDPKRQQQAVDAVNRVLKARGQPGNLRGALVSIDPTTGAIIAYYGGDNGVGTDYAQARRQPGSSFKPFVLSAALQGGVKDPNGLPVGLGSQYDGSSPQEFVGIKVANSEGYSCNPCDVKTAMTQSVNTVFYRMGLDVGPARVADAAHQAGIPEDELPNPTAGIALGDKEVRPLDMAAAFATFAADGVRHEPYLVAKVTAADGRLLYDHGTPTGQQAVPQPVARNVTEAMKDVPGSSRIAVAGGRDQAGKTGTVQHPTLANQNKDAWTVGFTPEVSTAVWVGTDTSEPIKNAQGRPVYGRMLPGSIWQAFMNSALRGVPAEPFSPFTALGTAPGTAVLGEDDGKDDEDSDEEDTDSEDSDNKKKKDSDDGDRTRGNGREDASRQESSDGGEDTSG